MRLFAQLSWYFRREWRRYLGAIALLVIIAVLQLIPPKVVGIVVDGVTQQHYTAEKVWMWIGALVLIAVMVYLLRYVWRVLLFGASYQLAVELREDFYRQLSRQHPAFYLRHRTGDLIARATNDVDRVVFAAGEGVLTLVDSLVMGCAVLIVMSTQISWQLTLLALLPMPLMALAIKRNGDALHERFRVAQAAFSSLNDRTQESLTSIRMIKAFGLEDRQSAQFAADAADTGAKNMRVARIDARFDPTIYIAIGAANLLAIGGGSWWGDNDDALSVKAIQTAVEQGIRWIDTAPIYGLYHSETVVGEAMKHIDRDKVVLSTKCGLEWRHETPVLHKVVDGTTVYRDLSAQSIIEDVEDSLRRLHTDHLDVLYTHWQTPDFGIYPLEETVEAMMKLKEQGKIRAIGASNVTADIIRGYCKYGQLDVIQEKYSLLTRRVEKQLLPTCKELGVSVQAYSPLEQGLLTGKVTMDTTYPEGSTRNSNPSFQPARRAQALDMLAKWGDLTEKYDCSLAQLVIALTARMIPGLHVLCGARTPQQVMDNAGALNIKLDGADAVRMKWDVDAIS